MCLENGLRLALKEKKKKLAENECVTDLLKIKMIWFKDWLKIKIKMVKKLVENKDEMG